MSGHRRNADTIYLRPQENTQEYQIVNAAKWLVRLGHFKSVHAAHTYMHKLEYTQPWRFKAMMSSYYAAHFRGHVFQKFIDINDYRTGGQNTYGDEPHMYM